MSTSFVVVVIVVVVALALLICGRGKCGAIVR